MTRAKIQKFTDRQNALARMAKALAHPARIAIVQHIIAQQSCICNDLVEELPLSQSTISQHLNELKSAGLIKGEISGPRVCYCIDEKMWKMAKEELLQMFDSYNQDCTDGCC